MRLEDLKKEMPDTPDFIHQMIQEEVGKQVGNTGVAVSIASKRAQKKRWSVLRVAAAAVVCVLAVSTAAYGAYRIYHISLEKQGTYRVGIEIAEDHGTVQMEMPEEIPEIAIGTSYIPEGMEWSDESHLAYPETPWNGGFSFSSVLLDGNDLGQALTETGIVEYEEETFGGFEGVYLRYQDLEQNGTFNQRIYLLCPEEYRVLIIFIGDDVSKEDAVKVAENITVEEKDTMVETEYLLAWSDFLGETEDGDTYECVTTIAEDKLKVFGVGDTLQITASGEDENGEYISDKDVSVKVDSVVTADDLSLLDEAAVPDKWKNAVGEDGKLVNNTLSYIKRGDGVETLDEVVKTETVSQKLLFVTVTYQNNTKTPIYHMLYNGSLMLLNQTDGNYEIAGSADDSNGEYDDVSGDSVAMPYEMGYYSEKEEYGNGGNYISVLNAGEAVQVEMAWIVNESDLDRIYLNLSGEGGSVEFSEMVQKTGVVDIRQTK